MKHPTRLLPLLLAALLLGTSMTACTGPSTSSTDTTPDTAVDTPAETVPGTMPATVPETEAPTDPVTEPETEPPVTKPERTEMDIYENGYNVNLLVGFDEYGRSIPAVSARREDKEVGIFYFLWLGQHGTPDIYDISHIRAEYGDDVMFHQDVAGISPAVHFHWWEEPLYGYYNSADEWVIRRHMELLTSAGVDFLMFDATNCFIYESIAEKVMKISAELRQAGWDAPQVTWLTHSRSIQTIQTIYNTFYKTNKYPESWYCVDGKPMMIGYTTAEKDLAEAASRGDTSYNPGDLSPELCDFFYMREVRWPYDPVVPNSWPYTEWSYPQPKNTDMISVSIATHPGVPFSFSLTHDGWMNWGRGYDVRKKVNVSEDIYKGTFFEYQWRTVFKQDPKFVCITGWNEWVAQKNFYGGEYAFVDNVDMEYSRDAEPMKGGYEDAYYIQMMYNIRKYKYEPVDGLIASTVRKTIDVTASPDQWSDVNAVYRRIGTDDGSRNSVGGAPTVHYTQEAARNTLEEIRVTADETHIYFYIKASSDIAVANDREWMNIFIGTGSAPTMKGWEGYDFVINRSRTDTTASIERLSADYSGETLGATATYSVQGTVMQVSIPRSALGLEAGGDFYFKVADGIADPAEIMDYYVSGRSMPVGRLSYLYQMD